MLRAKVLTVRFDTLTGTFDDAALQEFIKDKDVVSIRDHLVAHDGRPCLALLICYRPRILVQRGSMRPEAGERKPDETWKKWIAEEDVPLFNALRDWRAERCKVEGVPPYVICTNRQLAAVVNMRPQTLGQLGEVDGLGKAKLERYGRDILDVVARRPRDARRDEPPAAQNAGPIEKGN